MQFFTKCRKQDKIQAKKHMFETVQKIGNARFIAIMLKGHFP